MQWRDDTTLPPRGQGLRQVGKSYECSRRPLGTQDTLDRLTGRPHSRSAPKADMPCDLPPPTFGERRHRGLARSRAPLTQPRCSEFAEETGAVPVAVDVTS